MRSKVWKCQRNKERELLPCHLFKTITLACNKAEKTFKILCSKGKVLASSVLAVVLNVATLLKVRLSPQPDAHHVLDVCWPRLVDLQEIHDLIDIAVDKQDVSYLLMPINEHLPGLCAFDDTATTGKDISVGLLGHHRFQ